MKTHRCDVQQKIIGQGSCGLLFFLETRKIDESLPIQICALKRTAHLFDFGAAYSRR